MAGDDDAERSPEDRLTTAAALLDRARTADEPARAVQALVEIAKAAGALGWDLDRSDAESVAATLRAMATRDRQLVDWAVLTVTNLLYDDDPGEVVDALLARSGYQLLRDLGDDADSRLDPGHLADVDAELAEVVEERGLAALVAQRRPTAIPHSHSWWFEPAG